METEIGDKMIIRRCEESADQLIEEMDDDNVNYREILRIKFLLDSQLDHSKDVLILSLRQLQLMEPPVDAIKSKDILSSVKCMMKNSQKRIRKLASVIIKGWSTLVDDWMNDCEVKVASPKTSLFFPDVEEHLFDGHHFPAFDVEDVLASQTISFDYSTDISNFFDDVDDSEDVQNIKGKSTMKNYSIQNIITKKQETNKPLKSQEKVNLRRTFNTTQPTDIESARVNQRRTKIKKQEDRSRRRRLRKVNELFSEAILTTPISNEIIEKKTANRGSNLQIQKSSLQNPLPLAKSVRKDLSYEERLFISKRKLQESYNEANNDKLRRKVKLIDIEELPRQQCKRRTLKKV